jgi:hypothetical protein
MKNRIFYTALLVAIVIHLSFYLILSIKPVRPIFITESELFFVDSAYNMFKPLEESSIPNAKQKISSFFVLPGIYQKTVSSEQQRSIEVLKQDSADCKRDIFKEENKLVADSMSFMVEQPYARPLFEEEVYDKEDAFMTKLLKVKKQNKIYFDKKLAYLFEPKLIAEDLKKNGFVSGRLYDINITFYNKRLFFVRVDDQHSLNDNRQMTEVLKKALKRSVQIPQQLKGEMLLNFYD